MIQEELLVESEQDARLEVRCPVLIVKKGQSERCDKVLHPRNGTVRTSAKGRVKRILSQHFYYSHAVLTPREMSLYLDQAWEEVEADAE